MFHISRKQAIFTAEKIVSTCKRHRPAFLAAEHIHRHGVRHRRLFSRRTAGARPHLQHGVRYLTRRRDIRDALVEPFLTRRQQHRRQRPEQYFSVHRFNRIKLFSGTIPILNITLSIQIE